MANRFLETNYYKSPFVRSLKGSIKGLYSFIICDCTPSGIWAKDLESVKRYINHKFLLDDELSFRVYEITHEKVLDFDMGKYEETKDLF